MPYFRPPIVFVQSLGSRCPAAAIAARRIESASAVNAGETALSSFSIAESGAVTTGARGAQSGGDVNAGRTPRVSPPPPTSGPNPMSPAVFGRFFGIGGRDGGASSGATGSGATDEGGALEIGRSS